jgi:hypothetical protein
MLTSETVLFSVDVAVAIGLPFAKMRDAWKIRKSVETTARTQTPNTSAKKQKLRAKAKNKKRTGKSAPAG